MRPLASSVAQVLATAAVVAALYMVVAGLDAVSAGCTWAQSLASMGCD